jgi:hypothetical protein
MFGAKLLKHKGFYPETTTYIQYGVNRRGAGALLVRLGVHLLFLISLSKNRKLVSVSSMSNGK